MKPEVEHILKTHSQIHEWTCAPSAYEFVAKLHGKIAADEFPLQNGPDAQKAGFQFERFLNDIGFKGTERKKVPADALDLLKHETADGRYPLVSIVTAVTTQGTLWHIVVAIEDAGEVILLDPAAQQRHTSDSHGTLSALEATVKARPDRPKIHILTYTELFR